MTSRDITNNLFEEAQCALFLVDEKGHVVKANRRAVALTGSPMRELEKHDIQSLIQPIDWDLVWTQVAAPGGSPVRLDGTLANRKGRPVQVECVVRTIEETSPLASVLVCARDIREECQMKERLRERMRSASVIHERERKRIARALHDCAIHDLLTVTGSLDAAIRSEPDPSVGKQLEEVRLGLTEITDSLRQMIGQLRADELESGDLISALESLVRDAQVLIPSANLLADTPPGRLSKYAEFILYRIAQEGIRNTVRHARATSLAVHLQCDDEYLSLSIRDNGAGFTAPSSEADASAMKALGLQGVYERVWLLGGTLTIDSSPEAGTSINVSVPLALIYERQPYTRTP